jgi:hypothetical protein
MLLALALVVSLPACDFVDEDGNTSIRQVAEGLQSLGGGIAHLGEAIARDADVASVPSDDLAAVLPRRVEGAELMLRDGEDAVDRNGAGLSIAHGRYVVDGDSLFVGVADLGALRSGAVLALRWVAPLVRDGEIDGEIEETEFDGHPAIRIRSERKRGRESGYLIAFLVEGRFAVLAGADRAGHEAFVREILDDVDYRRLEGWADYGTR